MKKIFLLTLALGAALPTFANLNGNGYYRIENYVTARYAEIIDNTFNVSGGVPDLHAIRLNKDFNEVISDPSSVIYITNTNGAHYDLTGQGTSMSSMSKGYELTITANGTGEDNQTTYMAFIDTGEYGTFYLGDGNSITSAQYGTMTTAASGNFRKWYVKPIDTNGENFFGANLTVAAGGKYYTTMYAMFPYTPQSSKIYYIKRIDHGMAEMVEFTGGTVPSGTPVIIEGSAAAPASNRMAVGGSGTAPSGNNLKGVIYDYNEGNRSNFTAYNPSTMRVLGVCSDGSLGFITASIPSIPANSCYITVPAGSPAEFKCVTTAEFDAYEPEPDIPTAPEALYVIGNFNGWTTPDQPGYITLSQTGANVYSGTISYSTPGDLAFKVFDALTSDYKNAYGATNGAEVSLKANVPSTWTITYGGGSDFKVNNWGGGSGTITVNLENNTLTLETATVYEGSLYPENLWLVGNFTETPWTPSDHSYPLNTVSEGIYSGEFNIGNLGEEGLSFKLVPGDNWDVSYGAPIANSSNYNIILFNEQTVTSNVAKNSGNWCITNWVGGTLKLTIDLVENEITIEGPDQPAPTSEDVIYMIGDMNEWNFTDSSYKLHITSENIYAGTFDLPAATYYFRFYSALGNADQNSLGAAEDSELNIPVVFAKGNDTYTASIYEGKGNWVLENWKGGNITFTVNLNTNTLTLYSKGAAIETVGSDVEGQVRYFNLQGVEIANPDKGIYIRVQNGKSVKVVR